MLAHSNGGQVALRLASPEWRARSPEWWHLEPGLEAGVARPQEQAAGRPGSRAFAPWLTLTGNLRTDLLTRDPVIQEEHRADRSRHSRMSPRLFFGMVEGGEMVVAPGR